MVLVILHGYLVYTRDMDYVPIPLGKLAYFSSFNEPKVSATSTCGYHGYIQYFKYSNKMINQSCNFSLLFIC